MNVRKRIAGTRARKVAAAVCNIPCFKKALVDRLRGRLPTDQQIESAREIFSAVNDPARIKILFALSGDEELCVCDVAHVLGTSVAVASHHLRKLRDLHVLQYRNDGKMAYYSIRDPLAGELVATTLKRKG